LSETLVGVAPLVHVLIAVLDLKWGRGVAFTALALLAAAFYRKEARKPSASVEPTPTSAINFWDDRRERREC
jgi:hypothetical protein